MKRIIGTSLILFSLLLIFGNVTSSIEFAGRNFYLDGGVFDQEDCDWLFDYSNTKLSKNEFGAAKKTIGLVEAYCPQNRIFELGCYKARYHYATESHRGGHKKFEEIYKAEENAYLARGASLPDDIAKANNKVISRVIIETLSTPNKWGTRADVATISNYDSPTRATGQADMKQYQYDLRWCVNFVYLIRQYDINRYSEARDALNAIINEKRTYRAYYEEITPPKSTKDRARDEVRATATAYGARLLPGAIGREIHRAYNLEAFGSCIQRPISIYDMRVFSNSVTKIKEDPEIVITPYEHDGVIGYRAKGSCSAEADIALADVLQYFNIDPYTWGPSYAYVGGDREKKPKDEESAETEDSESSTESSDTETTDGE